MSDDLRQLIPVGQEEHVSRKLHKLGIKILPEQKRALELLAKLEGEAESVVIRRLIREEAQRKGLWEKAIANE